MWLYVGSICVLCYKQAESSSHLFLNFDFAVALWRWLGAQLNYTFSLIFVASLLNCLPQRCSSQIRDVFMAAILHTINAIWLARNSIHFSFATVSIHNTMTKISSMVDMSGTNLTDNCLSSDIIILKNFLIPPSHRHVREIVTVI